MDVTTKCNLRCVHCYNNSGAGDDLAPSAMLALAGQIAQLRPFNVCLCGGEPLCCPCLLDIIRILRPHVGKVNMVTNGWALTKDLAQKLADCGLDTVQVSLDGAFAWQHDSLRGVTGSFERAVAAITLFKQVGIKQVFVSLVPNKLNQNSMTEFMLLCRGLKVDAIRTMPFLPSGRGRTIGRRLMLSTQEYFAFIRRLRHLNDFFGLELHVEWSDPLSHLRLMQEYAKSGRKSMDMETRANGDLAVSTYLPITVGNCQRHTLKEYWLAGYDRIWADPRLTTKVQGLQTVMDLEQFEPLPYSGETLPLYFLEENL